MQLVFWCHNFEKTISFTFRGWISKHFSKVCCKTTLPAIPVAICWLLITEWASKPEHNISLV